MMRRFNYTTERREGEINLTWDIISSKNAIRTCHIKGVLHSWLPGEGFILCNSNWWRHILRNDCYYGHISQKWNVPLIHVRALLQLLSLCFEESFVQTLLVQESRVLREVFICYRDHHVPPQRRALPLYSIYTQWRLEGGGAVSAQRCCCCCTPTP